MRYGFAISSFVGILAVTAGCQRACVNHCPHCHQYHANVEANPVMVPSTVAPVTHWESPTGPRPQAPSSNIANTRGLAPIPAVPGVIE